MITRAQVEEVLGHPLSDEQWQATSAPLTPGVIVAGAGSGKTSVMAARVIWAVGAGLVRADQVLGLTFTNKAAAELLTRIREALARAVRLGFIASDDTAGDPLIATYHSFAASLISENGIRIGLEPTAVVLTPGGRAELAARIVRTGDATLASFGRSMSMWVRDLLALDDALADTGVSPDRLEAWDSALIADLQAHHVVKPLQVVGTELMTTAQERRALAGLVRRFRAEKVRLGRIDFADQTRLALDLAATFEDVLNVCRERHHLVLLDEYQDTSLAQRMLLQRLFAGGHAVTAVGDPFQAIYGFRGATVDNIDRFLEHFSDGSSRGIFTLSDNRRSGPAILEAANSVARPLREVHTSVKQLRSAAAAEKGPGLLTCALFETVDDETRWLVDQVRELGAQDGEWSGIAVLVRAREHAAVVNRALTAAGVPTHVEGASDLLERPEIIELRSMLEVLVDPTANVALMRLLAGPRWALGVRDLAALGAHAAALIGGRRRSRGGTIEQSLVDAVVASDPSECISLLEGLDDATAESAGLPPISAEGRQRMRQLADELRGLRRHLDEPLPELIGRVLAVSGLGVEIAIGDPVEVQTRAASISEFLSLASSFSDVEGGTALLGFLGLLRVCDQYDITAAEVPSPSHPDAVRIMTVHKSKGLEFRHVLLPYVCDGVFPSSQGASRWPDSPAVIPWGLRADEPGDLPAYPVAGEAPRGVHHKAFVEASRGLDAREELRLAYVALTRAETTLAVTGHWWGPRQIKPRGASPVLAAVHEYVRTNGGSVPVWAPEPEEGESNPLFAAQRDRLTFPFTPDPVARARRVAARDAVLHQMGQLAVHAPVEGLAMGEAQILAAWDRDLPALVEQAMATAQATRVVPLPPSMSASDLIRLAEDPDRYLLDLARPMPRRPAPAARRGTRFHAWLESRYGQQPLLLPDDLPGAADDDIASDADLALLREAFQRSEFASRTPVAIEEPFALVLAGRVIRGRIDAVFSDGQRPQVIDWKTGTRAGLHPLQLAIYRLAWAEQHDLDVADVDAAFVLVSTGEVVVPTDLPGRDELESLLRGDI